MKTILLFFTSLLCITILTACQQENKAHEVKIGIVVPLQHKAMDEIVNGFVKTLKETTHQPVKITVANAQNDANIERAIIQEMRDSNSALIVPIGTDATQMTLSMVRDQPVVSLAAELSEQDRKKLLTCNVAIVHDEISSQEIMQFLHEAYPNIKRLTLIHSSANKIFPEVAETIAAGKKLGITINEKMIYSLPELMSAAQTIPDDTQGLFILKDHLMVSGISTLARLANQRHIPLMTSDQGSVQDGAGFALGVHEREIGVEGAKLAARILDHASACDLPISEMKRLTVFINPTALQHSGQTTQPVTNAAAKLHYAVEFTNKKMG